jgi:hypothetical protein
MFAYGSSIFVKEARRKICKRPDALGMRRSVALIACQKRWVFS